MCIPTPIPEKAFVHLDITASDNGKLDKVRVSIPGYGEREASFGDVALGAEVTKGFDFEVSLLDQRVWLEGFDLKVVISDRAGNGGTQDVHVQGLAQQIIEALLGAFKAFVDAVVEILSAIIDAFLELFNSLLEQVFGPVVELIRDFYTKLTELFAVFADPASFSIPKLLGRLGAVIGHPLLLGIQIIGLAITVIQAITTGLGLGAIIGAVLSLVVTLVVQQFLPGVGGGSDDEPAQSNSSSTLVTSSVQFDQTPGPPGPKAYDNQGCLTPEAKRGIYLFLGGTLLTVVVLGLALEAAIIRAERNKALHEKASAEEVLSGLREKGSILEDPKVASQWDLTEQFYVQDFPPVSWGGDIVDFHIASLKQLFGKIAQEDGRIQGIRSAEAKKSGAEGTLSKIKYANVLLLLAILHAIIVAAELAAVVHFADKPSALASMGLATLAALTFAMAAFLMFATFQHRRDLRTDPGANQITRLAMTIALGLSAISWIVSATILFAKVVDVTREAIGIKEKC